MPRPCCWSYILPLLKVLHLLCFGTACNRHATCKFWSVLQQTASSEIRPWGKTHQAKRRHVFPSAITTCISPPADESSVAISLLCKRRGRLFFQEGKKKLTFPRVHFSPPPHQLCAPQSARLEEGSVGFAASPPRLQ